MREHCGCRDPYAAAMAGAQDVPSHYQRHHHQARGMVLQPGGHVPARFFAAHPTILQVRARARLQAPCRPASLPPQPAAAFSRRPPAERCSWPAP